MKFVSIELKLGIDRVGQRDASSQLGAYTHLVADTELGNTNLPKPDGPYQPKRQDGVTAGAVINL